MEITWQELLTSDPDKRIKILTTIYAEYQEFKRYQDILKQALLERASENLKTTSTTKNEVVEMVNTH